MSTLTRTRPGAPGKAEEAPPGATSHSSGRTLALVGVLLITMLMLMVPVRSWLTQRSDLSDLKVEIEQAQQRVDGLRLQRELWGDPTFIAEQARLRLNFVRAGEAGLLVLDEEAESSVRRSEGNPDTWWGKLWGSVDELSGRRAAESGGGTSRTRPDAPR